jgi:hypothetical protein
LIHSGFLDWCNDGSIFEQDISAPKLPTRTLKSNREPAEKCEPNADEGSIYGREKDLGPK